MVLPEIDIPRRLAEIHDMGWIASHRSDDTGIGKTIEDILNIPENNSGEPDFMYDGVPIELKSHRFGASSRITLITKVPYWKPMSQREIIDKLGYIDCEGRQGLMVTLKVNETNPKGFGLELNEHDKRLNIIHQSRGVVSYFELNELMDAIRKKLYENLLVVSAKVKKQGGIEYFQYIKGILYTNLSLEKLIQLLEDGVMVYEFRMHLKEKPDGTGFKIRDHGPGFRISENSIEDLYENMEIIFETD